MSTETNIMDNLKQLVRNNKLFLSNLSYIGIFQILILILPLISYPYLIRIVGADLYGRVAYAQAAVVFAIILVNFGLNIMATKEVSINRDNPIVLDRIVTKVYIIKTCFFILSSLIYAVAIFYFETFAANKLLFLLSFGYCLPEWLLPIWYFQGIEKMKYMTLVDSIAKVFFTILIFFVISIPEHYIRIPIVQTIGTLIGASVGFALLFGKEGRRFVRTKLSEIKDFTKEAIPFFLSRVSAVTISQLSTLFVGKYLGYVEVAWLDLARKVVNILMIPSVSINSALYPRIAHSKSRSLVRKALYFQGGLGLIIYGGLFIATPLIVSLLGGSEMLPAMDTVRFYSLLIILYHFNYYIGTPVMIPMGLAKEFNLSVIFSLFLFLGIYMAVYMLHLFSLNVFIGATIVTEIMILCYRTYYCHKHKVFKA
ncbi:oligosaccharide flippase family protein [Porphyromonas sp.]|uniref:oligosaccharide flippase family protein n=1 Tax=Porphyromonas sp. TaxID=1924944 RepID=UPI0026DC1EE2|nr:oligosaccharide flippase family protein [Porphyromonas sp.]MDO4695367.1 oligosaccharide flippase family protein [Porphyromonas sp.]MDO4770368.1 oligosaccharide flippase family protein [Porphyromonas sp.]